MNGVQDVLKANIASKAAGDRLLEELPWQQTMQARLRSLMLLAVIAAAFWVSAQPLECWDTYHTFGKAK
jgi:hypothetical protein